MMLLLEKVMLEHCERVKSIDFHPSESWIIASLYNGKVVIWNYETSVNIRTFDVSSVPIRAVKFISRKNWFVCGADDFLLRVYNYNTLEKVNQIEAHNDYIRCIAVHPTQSFLLTGGDDMLIRLWDWDNSWKCLRVFEGHGHYVMALSINPRDTNTFVSCNLDRTVKVWSLGSSTSNYTLDAGERGINYVEYYNAGDKPFLITAGDDSLIKIWDYQTKSCVQTLEGHSENVSFACFYPELPIIISGSEDGSIKVWNSNTYKLEQTFNYGLERAWCIGYLKGNNSVAIGYDEGILVLKIGREQPAVSMDSTGKIIWAKYNDIHSSVIKPANDNEDIKDGVSLALSVRDMGSCEIYPQSLQHSPNGRFVVVCGDGEYIIYTALAWRNKAFGSALDFAWASDSNEYAIRESSTSIRIYRNFKERNPFSCEFIADGIFGGQLLGVKGHGFFAFYDWETYTFVRKIDVSPNEIYWSESGTLFTIACDDIFYLLKFNHSAYINAIESGSIHPEDGVEDAFEVITNVSECIKSGKWAGDCFIYSNSMNRINYLVGNQVYTISHFDTCVYVLGYIPRDGRLYFVDKDIHVIPYELSLSVVEYQTLVLRGDIDGASELLRNIPQNQMTKIARFLDGQGYKDLAMNITTDLEQRFDLAIQLRRLDIAVEVAQKMNLESKWKTLGDASLLNWDLCLAEECYIKANDLENLLLLYSSTGNVEKMKMLAKNALDSGKNNIAFTCLLQIQDVDSCTDIFLNTKRFPEACLFARTYAPSQIERVLKQWKEYLEQKEKHKLLDLVVTSTEDISFFPDLEKTLDLEREFRKISLERNNFNNCDLINNIDYKKDSDDSQGSGLINNISHSKTLSTFSDDMNTNADKTKNELTDNDLDSKNISE
ncbi:hypothetical protein T552_00490 [Pneumocystis carinii B80]|uniref:Coatomer subunit beta' n=1 Tax=Pneumocystis carinii (strain B80) TaxID=1408658 RepID=A0A0W4ZQX3_PNEC8|nr:hypothetical protein T552_00490 [Pneumocystis carinii B80]KTW30778.1 hypothetical protein T552_00490 [Pneumocystis carinii B80]